MTRWLSILLVVFAFSCSLTTNRQGGVRVISSVPDAVLSVDEEVRGPVRGFEQRYLYVNPGTHRLTLEHPDHFTEYIEVDVPSNRGVAVRVEMRPRPE